LDRVVFLDCHLLRVRQVDGTIRMNASGEPARDPEKLGLWLSACASGYEVAG
jgi:hypothetical protein